MNRITFGILTVSDSCFAKQQTDYSGPKLEECVKSAYKNSEILFKDIVPDSQPMIENTLVQWSLQKCDVILTTGGTGFAARDVTPEATRAVIDKEAPGLSYAMLSKSLAITDFAMLSRAVCGIKNNTLIINLPGSVKGSSECFKVIKNSLPHAVALLTGNLEVVSSTHKEIQNPHTPITPSKVKMNQVAGRDRVSPYPLLDVSKALEIIFKECPQDTAIETVDIGDCINRVLAEDVYSKEPLPPFAASIKDGYAVVSSDGAGVRSVRDVVAAGDTPSTQMVVCGEIIRISTGAPVPEGADAVVQVEDTELIKASPDGSKELQVEIKVAPKLGQDIRPVGSDIPPNSLVLNKGDCLSAGHVGVLATVGVTKIKVYKRPSIGIISTGNELQSPQDELKPGHIRDSNKLTLLNLLKQYSFVANDCGITRDDPDSVKEALERALSLHDMIITTGGVSMGERDLIKQVLIEDFSAQIHFGRVNMKPGKPTTFATCSYKGTLKMIFGLPGNPVSATVTSVLFVIPALRYYEKNSNVSFPKIPVCLGETVLLDPRPEYIRTELKKEKGQNIIRAYQTGNQISSRINSFVGATALLILPGKNTCGCGDTCEEGTILEACLLNPTNIAWE